MKRPSRWIVICAPVVCLFCVMMPARAQSGAKNGEWRTYGGDLASTRYSALDQINADNFNTLTVAWRFKTDSLGPRPEFKFEATPLMVHGVLYSTGGSRRAVMALDASTGTALDA
jgi:quinoprotein glucose dehydrogenase